MKRMILASTILAASTIFGAAAYAQGAQDQATPKAAPGAGQGHEAHCCKPDPADPRGAHGMSEHQQDHSQAAKRPGTRKSERKPTRNAGENAN